MTNSNHDQALDKALGQLRRDMEAQRTPPRVEQALVAAFAKRQRRQRVQRFISQVLAPLVAVSATATVAAFMVFAPATLAPVNPATPQQDSLAYLAAADTPFVALASADQIAREPSPRVVQADVPMMWLASAGVSVAPDMAEDSVRAELLVGADGEALAVRLMP